MASAVKPVFDFLRFKALKEGRSQSLGSQRNPDNQTDRLGSYSWLGWVNGIEPSGRRHWPAAPPDLFAALGHAGRRGLAVLPDLDKVVSWNDGRMDDPVRENEAFGCLVRAVVQKRPEQRPARSRCSRLLLDARWQRIRFV